MPVKMVGSRAVATVAINGHPVPLTVDSGAFFSVLTEAAATQLDLRTRSMSGLRVEGITGAMDARVTTVERLQLIKGDIPRVDFIVGGNEPGAGTMGLLGRNFLSFTDTEYDLANGVIRLSFPSDDCKKANLAYWAGAAHVTELDLEPSYRSRSKAPPLRARVKLNGTEAVALLDTGARTIVTLRAARRAGITDAQMTPSPAVSGIGRGTARAWTAPFERVEIGDEAISNNRLHVGDFDLEDGEMLLGIDFFLSHRIYVSKTQDKMFITYNGGTVFALNRGSPTGPSPVPVEAAASGMPAPTADQLARRGAASAARREFDRALADLNQAIALDATAPAHFVQRGLVLEALRRPDDAMADFEKAISLEPNHAEARFARAMLRLGMKDWEGAQGDLDVLDKTLAPQAQLRLAMSTVYLRMDQPAQAVAQLNRWLPAHPNEVNRYSALNSRCWARALLGVELHKALDDCNDAISAEPKNAAYLDSRGWVLLRLGRNREAIADFDGALALRPAIPVALYGRGLAMTRLGEAAKGSDDLAAARKAEPDIERRLARIGLTADLPKP